MASTISSRVDDNIENFSRDSNYGVSFDVLRRIFYTNDQKCCLFLIDGTANQETLAIILSHLLSPSDVAKKPLTSIKDFCDHFMPYAELKSTDNYNDALETLLGGAPIMFVDGIAAAFHIDAKHFPQRTVTEPEKDKVIRGSRDGFVEITIFNAALLRRRLRSPDLVMEAMHVGTAAPSDVIVCYMRGRASDKTVELIKSKINGFSAEAMTMNQETLSERVFKQKWYNPYPLVRYSERPDLTSASLMEGSVVIITDNSPSVMILPARFVDFFIEANDYYFPPMTGTYYRLIRVLMILIGIFFVPLVVLVTQTWSGDVPAWLAFMQVKGESSLPLLAQIIIFEFIIEAVRSATMNIPSAYGAAMSIIGSVFIGEFTVQSGWAAPEVVFYMSFISIALYAQQNLEFGYTVKFFRILLTVMSYVFGLWGFFGMTALIFLLTVTTRTIDGGWYFDPIIPFHPKKLLRAFFRTRLRR